MTGKAWILAGAMALAALPVDGARADNGCGWGAENAVVAETIYFAVDSTRLTETERLQLMAVADAAQDRHARAVCVVGQADKQGQAAYNDRLAQRRADAVAQVLADYGVPRDLIHTETRGEAFGHTLDKLLWPAARDRYVEVVLTD